MLAYSNLIAYVKNKLLSYYKKDEVYNKTETYNTSEVYNKTETYNNTEVYNKTESYAKTEVYNKDESYNKDEVYNKTETYSQSEVDAFLEAQNDATEITYDATGNSFNASNVKDAIDALDNKPSVATLVDLTDTVITDPEEGHGIVYDPETGKWINGTVATSGGGGTASAAILNRYYEEITEVKDTFPINYSIIEEVAFVDVWLNGVKLSPSEFTATDGQNVIINTPIDGTTDTQVIEIITGFAADTDSISKTVNRTVYNYTAEAGQDTFEAIYDTYEDIDFFFEGHRLDSVGDFTATNGTQIILAQPAVGGESIKIVVYKLGVLPGVGMRVVLHPGGAELVSDLTTEPSLENVQGTNRNWSQLVYPNSTTRTALWTIPASSTSFYKGTKLKVELMWSAVDTAGNAKWSINLFSPNFDTYIDDATVTTDREIISSASATTNGMIREIVEFYPTEDELTSGNMLFLSVKRLGGDGDDTLVGDAKLLFVGLHEA